jgi:hypothetical protein
MTIVFHQSRYLLIRLQPMKLFFFPFIFLAFTTSAQLSQEESDLVAKLNFTNTIPTDLISTRSLVLYQNTFTKAELEETQKFFQQTGIDAVAYFDIARVLAGHDTRKAHSNYFNVRGIKFLIILQKNQKGYQYIFAQRTAENRLSICREQLEETEFSYQ